MANNGEIADRRRRRRWWIGAWMLVALLLLLPYLALYVQVATRGGSHVTPTGNEVAP